MQKSDLIIQKALDLGFDGCGIAKYRPLYEHVANYSYWLQKGYNGGLEYLERNTEKRYDPAKIVEGVKSIIMCAISYKRPSAASDTLQSKIASYALARDYHITIKEKLNQLLSYIKELIPQAEGRTFTDSAPILEKAWAVEAGLGWIGRNSLLIHPTLGSYILLGEILIDQDLTPTTLRIMEHCGNCSACKDQCPTSAINVNRTIDASRCLSRLTIERSERLVDRDLHNAIFGCDVCQQCCPHNNKAPIMNHPEFEVLPDFVTLTSQDWAAMTLTEFKKRFENSPLGRGNSAELLERIQKHFGAL